jgi:hypothetical protein
VSYDADLHAAGERHYCDDTDERDALADAQTARIEEAVADGWAIVPCPSHGWLPAYCERCHGVAWLTVPQLAPHELTAWLAEVRAPEPEADDDAEDYA